jgi:energy-coupling factor transporter ATP-binding protein EcfA2
MLFLKSLRLKNFCNYQDHTFDFTRSDGTPYPFVCFYGPNGVGKSSILDAISLLTSDQTGRPGSYVQNSLKKYVRNTNYEPSYQKLIGHQYQSEMISGHTTDGLPDMCIEGVYSFDDHDYRVTMNQDGWERNELAADQGGPWSHHDLALRRRLVYSIKTDSDLSLNTFQIHRTHRRDFEKIISTIMRYPVECISTSKFKDTTDEFLTDVILIKKEHKIHFKRMSAGERKICKSFSEILNLMNALENPKPGDPPMLGWPRMLLMDNVVMHVYYDRHATMVDCLKKVFSKQQIFGTTHSGTLIGRQSRGENDRYNELWINLEDVNS